MNRSTNSAPASETLMRNAASLLELASIAVDRPYNITVQIYTGNTSVPIAKGCFAYMFTNIGDTPSTVNGMIVFPSATPATALGDSRTIAGHWNNIYTGNITVSFVPPIGTAQRLELVQLYYI